MKHDALLWYPWKSGNDKVTINGMWPEDQTPYTLLVPGQLRDMIISLQNVLHEKHKRIMMLEAELAGERAVYEELFGKDT